MSKTSYQLACSTKKKREALVQSVVEMCQKNGFHFTVCPSDEMGPREDRINIVVGHFGCSIEFDAGLPINEFCADFYTEYSVVTAEDGPWYPVDFANVIRGSLNDTTFRKATAFHPRFETMLSRVERGLLRLVEVLTAANVPVEPVLLPHLRKAA